ncbi:uncharacterized protein LOC133534101 [Cydia pomonella]|uniref:uncharacterized protein LOC133534101 n=1 Tax=Cydia pomonella TaxID=82600 RepID=UPI002ADDD2F8|nr:uncharacterized protein LOC133534101 [Cydia pomonella]
MATLVPTRTSIKGRITKFKNYIADLNAQESIFSKDVDELSLKLDRFRSMFTQFDQIQTQIEIATRSEIQTEIDIREEMEIVFYATVVNDFISLIATAQKIIDKAAEGSDFASVKSEVQSNCGHDNTCNGLNFRLPVIKIASFDGSYFKWLEFRDTFDSLIHSSDNIKPIHKFHYLNSYLDGEAAQVISNLEVSDSNYAEAWRLLCERYDNKKQLISNHLNSLFNLQAIGRESAKSLRTHPRLDRFQRLEALRQHFWRRWQMEYVCELQQRTKWRVPGRALQLGDLVLIKEENTPPLHWRLGRISKLFPGADGISRVAEVATVTGTYKRGVKYLCPLLDETHEALKANASKGPQDVEAPTNEGEAGTAYQ